MKIEAVLKTALMLEEANLDGWLDEKLKYICPFRATDCIINLVRSFRRVAVSQVRVVPAAVRTLVLCVEEI